jgi:uncharacterized membrane protein YfcA
MTVVLIALAAFLASLLTFFSGFGLGTLLLAVMTLYFPVEAAVALTAIVHFSKIIYLSWGLLAATWYGGWCCGLGYLLCWLLLAAPGSYDSLGNSRPFFAGA